MKDKRQLHPMLLGCLVLALATVAGCGDDATCTADTDCKEGSYCGFDGTCVSDCSQDSDCVGGLVCDVSRGVCEREDEPEPDGSTEDGAVDGPLADLAQEDQSRQRDLPPGEVGEDTGGDGPRPDLEPDMVSPDITYIPRCNDGLVEGDEECDGTNMAGFDCQTFGYAGGLLRCTDSCTIDASACTSCGNNVIDPDEECDLSNLGTPPVTCQSMGFASGAISCTPSCRISTSGCTNCGNGRVDGSEECDFSDLGGKNCSLLGKGFTGGILSCTPQCTYDDTQCTTCGDQDIEGTEQCEGEDLKGASCETFPEFDGGILACSETCTFDTAGCTACGDGEAQGDETCDGLDVRSKTCSTLEGGTFSGGTLACDSRCEYDISECTTCGNGRAEPAQVSPDTPGAEKCDGGDLRGFSCASLGQGFTGGTLDCRADCAFDVTWCYTCGDGEAQGDEPCDTNDLRGLTCKTLFDNGSGTLGCHGADAGEQACTLDVTGCLVPPRVLSVYPPAAPINAPTEVTIKGEHFDFDNTIQVFVGADEATGVTSTDTEITCTFPAGPAGAYDVKVLVDGSREGVLKEGFQRFDISEFYYVDGVNGSDRNDGSINRPWLTLTHSLEALEYDGIDNQVLVVAPALYSAPLGETFPLRMPATLRILGSGPETTIVSGQRTLPVIKFRSNVNYLNSTQIWNLTVSGGDSGIRMEAGKDTGGVGTSVLPKLSRLVITNNQVGLSQEAVVAATVEGTYPSLNPRLEGCIITGNLGAGIALMGGSVPNLGCSAIVDTCSIVDNGGDGVEIHGASAINIFSSVVAGNTGSGFAFTEDMLAMAISDIVNTVVAHNRGGGIYLAAFQDDLAISIVNSTIAENYLFGIRSDRRESGQIFDPVTGDLAMVNSVVWHNDQDLVGTFHMPCACDVSCGCDVGCDCDVYCQLCECDITKGCDANCSACDPDCTLLCDCDTDDTCDMDCPCDIDCCLCDIDMYCDPECPCDTDCCECDSDTGCQEGCGCDNDCCSCDIDDTCQAGCPCDWDCCECDTGSGCQAGCFCDLDCCACDTDEACQENCPCDADCCECDIDDACQDGCACDLDCCDCDTNKDCQQGCGCDVDCCNCDTDSACQADCFCDLDCCPCDTDSACQFGCACDADCCDCNTAKGCQDGCACDRDCCDCDSDDECQEDCPCDMDCHCLCDLTPDVCDPYCSACDPDCSFCGPNETCSCPAEILAVLCPCDTDSRECDLGCGCDPKCCAASLNNDRSVCNNPGTTCDPGCAEVRLSMVGSVTDLTVPWGHEFVPFRLNLCDNDTYPNIPPGRDLLRLWQNQGALCLDDPEFVDPPQRDFHISNDSGCRGLGQDISTTPTTDMDGERRSDSIDLGADQFNPTYSGGPARREYYVDANDGSDKVGDGSFSRKWRSITKALAVLNAPDLTIHINPGTYSNAAGETFPITAEPRISLYGSTTSGETQVIGVPTRAIFSFPGSAGFYENTVLSQMTLSQGSTGIVLESDTNVTTGPTLGQLRITNNTGPGVSCLAEGDGALCTPVMVDVEISENMGDGYSCLAEGGGTCGASAFQLRVLGNQGHAVSLMGPVDATIDSSLLADNGGWGLTLSKDSAGTFSIINSMVYRNWLGGLRLEGPGANLVQNSTITRNYIYGILSGTTAPTVFNTILWYNDTDLSDPNIPLSYSLITSWPEDLARPEGLITQDPLLANYTLDDFHLRAGSPCIDRGTFPGPAQDFEEEDRRGAPDIGADEYMSEPTVEEAIVHYYVSPLGQDGENGGDGSADRPWRTITYAMSQLDQPDLTIHLMPGTYGTGTDAPEAFPIQLKPRISIEGTGPETMVVAPTTTTAFAVPSGIQFFENTKVSDLTIVGGKSAVSMTVNLEGLAVSPTFENIVTYGSTECSFVCTAQDGDCSPVLRNIQIVPQTSGEVCDDGVDNDEDGLTDCADPDCAGLNCTAVVLYAAPKGICCNASAPGRCAMVLEEVLISHVEITALDVTGPSYMTVSHSQFLNNVYVSAPAEGEDPVRTGVGVSFFTGEEEEGNGTFFNVLVAGFLEGMTVDGATSTLINNVTMTDNTTGLSILSAEGSTYVENSILWGNDDDTEGLYPREVAASNIGDNMGTMNADPYFAVRPGEGSYYLSQTAAGQVLDSPCVDRGNKSALEVGLHRRTTRTDGAGDSNQVDLGYHY